MTVLLRWTGGLIIWAIGFNMLYALHGVGCAAGWEARAFGGVSLFRWSLFLAWFAPAAAGAWLIWRERHAVALAERLALAGAVVGLTATIVTGAPIFFFPECL